MNLCSKNSGASLANYRNILSCQASKTDYCQKPKRYESRSMISGECPGSGGI